jgi:hypothetical protein
MSTKLHANPDGQVDLHHVEENQWDVALKLVGLLPSPGSKVPLQLDRIPRTPTDLNN